MDFLLTIWALPCRVIKLIRHIFTAVLAIDLTIRNLMSANAFIFFWLSHFLSIESACAQHFFYCFHTTYFVNEFFQFSFVREILPIDRFFLQKGPLQGIRLYAMGTIQ
eukprot:784632_1